VSTNPNGLLGTVTCAKWEEKAKVVLIGDASHAMVPFFGQGCNCGFEDVYWLSRLLDVHCPAKAYTPANMAACFAALAQVRSDRLARGPVFRL
jgi:2-polyprenyl-6-methoxyphenol hydroxylase-like FAD-dependent oxidoreductase